MSELLFWKYSEDDTGTYGMYKNPWESNMDHQRLIKTENKVNASSKSLDLK